MASAAVLLADAGIVLFVLVMIFFLGFTIVDAYEAYKRRQAKKHD
jgi:hypothetical protein